MRHLYYHVEFVVKTKQKQSALNAELRFPCYLRLPRCSLRALSLTLCVVPCAGICLSRCCLQSAAGRTRWQSKAKWI
jgi:hypothetical protein